MNIHGSYDEQNIFNQILLGQAPCIKVYEDDHSLAFMDIFPESDGHTLVIPKYKARNFLDLPAELLENYMKAVQLVARAVENAMQPAGIRVMQYNGAEATQTVFHLHFHIVPCYSGIKMNEHSAVMMDQDVLKQHASKIRDSVNLLLQ